MTNKKFSLEKYLKRVDSGDSPELQESDFTDSDIVEYIVREGIVNTTTYRIEKQK